MNLTRLALENYRVTQVVVVLVVLGGILSYLSLPRAEDPGFVMRTAQVTTLMPGASPDRVEQLITDKLEKEIQQIPELDYVESESKTGVSVVWVNILESYDEMRPIWDDLRRKVDEARPELPDEVIGPFVNDEFGDVFGIIVTLAGEGFSYAELKKVADEVRDELLLIGEVAKVELYGVQEERVFVEYNNARLSELGISPFQLIQLLETRNIIIPGGDITSDEERIVLEPSGNFETVDDLRRTVINVPGRADVLFLEDITTVRRGYIDPATTKMTGSGEPAIGIAISLREGGNILALGEMVEATLRRLEADYPIGIEFEVVAFQPREVSRKINEFVGNLITAIAVVAGVMLLFLGLRTGLVVATLVPTAILAAFIVMSLLNIGLNQISIASLILALGLLVDNAIVMAESILVKVSEGVERVEAAIESAVELRGPLLVSSLTTAAAFLPIFLAESTTGEYTAPIFKVVTITLLCSWVLALTMTPLLAVRFLKVKKKREDASYDSAFYRRYRSLLLWGLRNRAATIGMIVGIFVVALASFRFLPVIFFPPTDKAIFRAELELPLGTSIERTEEVIALVDRFIRDSLRVGEDRPEGVTTWATFIGQGAPRFVLPYAPEPPSPNYAFLLGNTSSFAVLDEAMSRLEAFTAERFPDLLATIRKIETGPPIESPVEIRILGRDPDLLFEMADRVKRRLAEIPGTRGISDDWGFRTKKLFVRVNQPRARRANVTSRDVAISLQTGLSGLQMTRYREEDELIPITLRQVEADRDDIGKLENLSVYAQATGESVPLRQVADIEVVWQPAKVLRRDRLKTVTISSQLSPGVTATEVVRQITPYLSAESRDWPIGYRWELGGEVETSVKANQSIQAKLPIAGLIIIVLLVGQFNSLRKAGIVLLTIPLGLIGVVFGLHVARSYFGFMTLLGIISLAGIVINNAIVLIDRIGIEVEEHGRSPREAILAAAQRRLRPILLTTATTMGGLLPLWLRGGAMWEPMAIAIIFGLLFATVLTLGFVPVVYSLFFKVDFGGHSYTNLEG